jgi:hypothetical protein
MQAMQLFMRKKHCVLVLMCLGMVACTTQEHTNAPQKIADKVAAEAKIFFESDYAKDTEFSVNDTNVVGNQCGDFTAVKFGDQLGKGRAAANKPAVMIHSASKLPVAVTARHHIEKKGMYSSCGPLTRVFVPEPNTSYIAKLVKEKDKTGNGEETGLCVLDIKKIDALSGKHMPIKTMAFSQCS